MLTPGQIQEHLQALDKDDDPGQRQAFLSLKELEAHDWAAVPPKVIPSVVESLQRRLINGTKRPFIRKEAATVLGKMGPHAKAAIPQLIELLRVGIPDPIREAAVTALGKIGKDARAAIEPLLELLSTSRTPLAVQAVGALSGIDCSDQRIRSTLVSLWLTPNQPLHNHIQVGLALCKLRIEAQGLTQNLAGILVNNQDASLRRLAASALGWCDEKEAEVVPALLSAALNDKSEDVRRSAEAGLEQLGVTHEQATKICSRQLKESAYAETALRNSGQLAVPALIEALGAPDSATREKVVRTLGGLGELAAAAAPALEKAAGDKDPDIRLAAAKSLWLVTKKADVVVPVLVDLLSEKKLDRGEENRRFLQTAIEALGRIGPVAKAAVPALNKLTKDKNRHVSEAAVSALREIDPIAAKK